MAFEIQYETKNLKSFFQNSFDVRFFIISKHASYHSSLKDLLQFKRENL